MVGSGGTSGRALYGVGFWAQQPFFVVPVDNIHILRPIWRSLPESQTVDWYRGAENLKTWTWQYNPNLIGRDRLPTGEQVYDLVPAQRPPEQIQLHSWQWSYNRNLVGRDRLPTGEQIFELPPRAPAPLLQTWLLGTTALTLPPGPDTTKIFRGPLYSQFIPPTLLQTWAIGLNLPLLAPPTRPTAQYDWPLPTQLFRLDQTIAASYNRNLIGQDRLPTGEQISDLYPRDPREVRAWQWTYNLNLIGRDRLPAGEQSFDLTRGQVPPPPENLKRWEWSYNYNLIGKDQLPTGEVITELPPRDPREVRAWQWSYNLNLISQDKMLVGEQVSDLWPRPYQQPAQSWAWNYNLNLRGQDQLPTGEQVSDLTPSQRAPEQTQLHTWQWSYNLNLIGSDRLPTGKDLYDLPPINFLTEPNPRRSWEWRYNLNLIGKDQLPVGEQTVDLPPRDPREVRVWSWSYNLNLVGQDKMVTGEQVTDLPPRDFARLFQTWISSLNLALTQAAPDLTKQTRQQDWPLPTQPSRLDQFTGASYNQNLIGQDKLPSGEQTTDLPPRDFARLFQIWISSVNLALVTTPPNIFAQARQQDWPTPRGAEPDWRRSWEWSYNRNLIAQDQLPFRQQDWPVAAAIVKGLDWIQSTNIALISVQKPSAQYDWPLTAAAQQPDRSIAASYLKTLIGQDRLPTGAQRFDLWPAGPQQPDRGFGTSFNLNLRGQDQLPNHQTDWPFPFGPQQPDRGFGFSPSRGLYFQPLGLPLNTTRIFDLTPPGYPPLLQQSVYEYNLAFIPAPTAPTLILRTLMGTGL